MLYKISIPAYLGSLAALFVSFFSTSTSPLYSFLGYDSAYFMLVGHAIKNGKRLYLDIFDHKGPVLYLIEYLGQILHDGRNGIFILQIIFLFGTLSLIYLISRLFLSIKLAWTIPAFFLFFLTFFYQYGNLSEEYSLFFCFLVIYLLFKNFKIKSKKYLFEISLSGAVLGLVFFLRQNNAVIIAATSTIYFVSIFAEMGRRELFLRIVVYITGFMSVTLIILLYFYFQQSLYEMLYATFLFNIKYSQFHFKDIPRLMDSGYIFWGAFGILLGIIGAILNYFKKQNIWVTLSTLAISFSSFFTIATNSYGYFHYLQLILIPLVLGTILIFNSWHGFSNTRMLYLINLIGILILFITFVNKSSAVIHEYSQNTHMPFDSLKKIISYIPEAERIYVFGYNVPASYYIRADIIPQYRYFTLHDFMGSHDRKIYDDLELFFENTPPKWALLQNGKISNKKIDYVFKNEYIIMQENADLTLLKLKSEN